MSRVLSEAVASLGRIITVDKLGQGDYQTIQEGINAAQAESPSDTEQWTVLVAPGVYAETLSLYDYVNVAGFAPGLAAVVKPSGAVAIAVGAECTLSNLSLSGDSSPLITTGTGMTGKLRLWNVLIENSQVGITCLWMNASAGEIEIRDSVLQAGGAALLQYAGTVKIFNSILRTKHGESYPGYYPYPVIFSSAGTLEVYHSLIENCTEMGGGVEFNVAPTLSKFQFCTVRQAGGVEAFKCDPAGNLDTVYLAYILANGEISEKITGMREGLMVDSNV